MNKLKTLQEIEKETMKFFREINAENAGRYIVGMLEANNRNKAEAVKDLDINGLTNVLGNLTDLDVIAIRKYIKWKFNLTEEDFK